MALWRKTINFLHGITTKAKARSELRELAKFDTYAERLAREINSAEIRIVKDEEAEKEAANAIRKFKTVNKRLLDRSSAIDDARTALPEEEAQLKALRKAVTAQLRDTKTAIESIHKIISLESSEILVDVRAPLSAFDLFIIEIRRLVTSAKLTGLSDAETGTILGSLNDVEAAYGRLVAHVVSQVQDIHSSYANYAPQFATSGRDLDIAQTLSRRTAEKRRLNGLRLSFDQKLKKFRAMVDGILDAASKGTPQQEESRTALRGVVSQLGSIYNENDAFVQGRINVGMLVVTEGHQLMIRHKQEIVELETLLTSLTKEVTEASDAITSRFTAFEKEELVAADKELALIARDVSGEDSSFNALLSSLQKLPGAAKRMWNAIAAAPLILSQASSRRLRTATALVAFGAVFFNSVAGAYPHVVETNVNGVQPNVMAAKAYVERILPGMAVAVAQGREISEPIQTETTVTIGGTFAPHYDDGSITTSPDTIRSEIANKAREAIGGAVISVVDNHPDIKLDQKARQDLEAEAENNPSVLVKNGEATVTLVSTATVRGADDTARDASPRLPGHQSGIQMDSVAALKRLEQAEPAITQALNEVYTEHGIKVTVTKHVEIVTAGPNVHAVVIRLNAQGYAINYDAVARKDQSEINKFNQAFDEIQQKNPRLYSELNGILNKDIAISMTSAFKATTTLAPVIFSWGQDMLPSDVNIHIPPGIREQDYPEPLVPKREPRTRSYKQSRSPHGPGTVQGYAGR